MSINEMQARLRRLHELANGFAAELVRLGIGDLGPMLDQERRQYSDAVGKIHFAIQDAEKVLKAALARIVAEERKGDAAMKRLRRRGCQSPW